MPAWDDFEGRDDFYEALSEVTPEEAYDRFIDDLIERADVDDATVPEWNDFLWDGWFNEEASPDQRHEAREMFFDYFGWEYDEFPWDDWRDWYDAG